MSDTRVPPLEPRSEGDPALETYNTVADTVGMVPNIRVKDNIVQGIAGVVCAVIGSIMGYVLGGRVPEIDAASAPGNGLLFALLGGIAGLIVGVIGTGLVLMIVGWVRAAKKIRS